MDDDGTFHVVLAEPGRYRVRVAEGDRSVHAGEVTFERPDRTVEIELPAGRIAGRVVGPGGHPMPGVPVQAVRADDLHRGEPPRIARDGSDAAGEFQLRDLEPGRWVLHARKGSWVALEKVVEIDGAEESRRVVLELRQARELRLQVLDAAERPVAGASLEVVPLGGYEVAPSPMARTDAEGRAAVRLGATPVSEAVVSVIADGQPVSVFRTPVGGAVHTLRLPPRDAAGTRVVSTPAQRSGILVLFDAGGGFVSLGALFAARRARWIDGAGATVLELERLAPGDWTLRRIDSPEAYTRLLRGEPAAGEVVASFRVEP